MRHRVVMGFRFRNRLLVLACAIVCALGFAGQADASQIVARNASHIQLRVNAGGLAMVSYWENGRPLHLLAWGAINARNRPARPVVPQVKFRLDYSGGRASRHRAVWKTFHDRCAPYDGPKLASFVMGCKAPDGSYWALQSWQMALPGLGFKPWLTKQTIWYLVLSHWTGPIAQLVAYNDWVYSTHRQELFGQYTYRGVGIRGFNTTRYGNPTDGYGRVLYLDTYNSRYGPGWRRANGFVSHGPPGMFCYGFFKHNPLTGGYRHPPGTPRGLRGPGNGQKYRLTAPGPGVTPDVMWEGPGGHRFNRRSTADASLEAQMNARLDAIRGRWKRCRSH